MNLAAAQQLAAFAHGGQTRRHGAPYLDHPRAVAALVDDLALACGIAIDDGVRAAAWLHDAVEDCPAVSVDRVRDDFGDVVADAVDHLTKTGKGKEATAAYYARLTRSGTATTRLIKVCDRLHNLSELFYAPNPTKLRDYVEETEEFVVPLAAGVHAGLVRALQNAIDNALENALIERGPRDHGIYAILQPTGAWRERLVAMIDGGVVRVQLRIKHIGRPTIGEEAGKPGDVPHDRAALALIDDAIAICRPRGVPVIVNDRADLAFAAGADGVHVGDQDIPGRHVRRLLGPGALIGTSTHTLEQCRAACVDADAFEGDGAGGADHVALGPLWLSTTKQGHAAVVGTDVLAAVAATTDVPLVGIGGINTTARVVDVARAGAAFAAVVSAFEVDDAAALHALVRRFSLSFVAATSRTKKKH